MKQLCEEDASKILNAIVDVSGCKELAEDEQLRLAVPYLFVSRTVDEYCDKLYKSKHLYPKLLERQRSLNANKELVRGDYFLAAIYLLDT